MRIASRANFCHIASDVNYSSRSAAEPIRQDRLKKQERSLHEEVDVMLVMVPCLINYGNGTLGTSCVIDDEVNRPNCFCNEVHSGTHSSCVSDVKLCCKCATAIFFNGSYHILGAFVVMSVIQGDRPAFACKCTRNFGAESSRRTSH